MKKQNATRRCATCLSVLIFIICLLSPWHATADKGVEIVTAAHAATNKTHNDNVGQTAEKIDQAGKKVSEGVDRFSAIASTLLGKWVNHEVFSGINWFKLLLI